MSADELAFVGKLGPLLSPSPRVLKRFVNTYRLFRATQDAGVEIGSSYDQRDHETCLFLLAVLLGMPELAKLFQVLIKDDAPAQRHLDGLVSYLDAFFEKGDDISAVASSSTTAKAEAERSARNQWNRIKVWLSSGEAGGWEPPGLGRTAHWAPRVGRYTFNLNR